MKRLGRVRGLVSLLRNLLLAAVLYACIFAVVQLVRSQAPRSRIQVYHEQLREDETKPLNISDLSPEIVRATHQGLAVKFAGYARPITINPHANVFNRPQSVVEPKDDFLGPRPHVDTEVYFPRLIDTCRGNYQKAERMPRVEQCLHYLAFNQGDYTHLPKFKRASQRIPREAEWSNSDGKNNTKSAYPSPEEAQPHSLTSRGSCAGPIVPYHTFWRGAATWRLELFVKSFLYTQNIPCSRLHIWLDADHDPLALNRTLTDSAVFKRFEALVRRGDIVLEEWRFPSRVAMLSGEDNSDGRGYPAEMPSPREGGEVDLGHGIAMDTAGQQWLAFTPKQLSLLPSPPLEAIRFITLHLHGGVYLDPDMMMIRDMRPLLIPQNHSFAMRWGARTSPGEYYTAVTALTANSSLSSYFVRGGVRMGMNFHPLVLGMMALKDHRNHKMMMLENSLFDPLWVGNGGLIKGKCPVPCLEGDESRVFKGRNNTVRGEWRDHEVRTFRRKQQLFASTQQISLKGLTAGRWRRSLSQQPRPNKYNRQETAWQTGAEALTTDDPDEDVLREAGIVSSYDPEEDIYPPTNRTMANFFRGAYTYQIHQQWDKHPEPSSWLDVIRHAHDGFFDGERTNPYGERWTGPVIAKYSRFPEFL